jgi:hypothetical protein
MAKFFFKYLKGSQNTYLADLAFDKSRGITSSGLNGETYTQNPPCDRSYVFTDSIGRLYALWNNGLYRLCIDINGIDKPNRWGVDRFIFYVTETNSVIPYTGESNGYGTEPLKAVIDDERIKKNCTTNSRTSHYACSYFALKNKSPDGKGDYWHDFLRGKY